MSLLLQDEAGETAGTTMGSFVDILKVSGAFAGRFLCMGCVSVYNWIKSLGIAVEEIQDSAGIEVVEVAVLKQKMFFTHIALLVI